jgi:hypothetical protein
VSAVALALELLEAIANDPLMRAAYRTAARRHLRKLREAAAEDDLTTRPQQLADLSAACKIPTAIEEFDMASKGQMTGMLGVYLVAAELSRLGFIVSPTSRSAAGADLLVTDQECQKAWSVQVKTNKKPANFWLLGAHAAELKSDSHAYVFVNIRADKRPEYIVAASAHVAAKVTVSTSKKGSVFYSFLRKDRPCEGEGWELLGDPHVGPDQDAEEGAAGDEVSS